VANLSAGTFGTDDGNCGLTNADPIHLAVCNVTAAGTLFVVAAGNSGGAIVNTVPAAYDEVLTTTWMTDYNGSPAKVAPPAGCDQGPDDRASANSSWAYDADKDHILAAPGSCITSTSNTGGTVVMSGSSMALPTSPARWRDVWTRGVQRHPGRGHATSPGGCGRASLLLWL
jgi:subtilisin